MCGIAGYLGKNRFDTKNIQNILETIYRRGPDSNGFKEIQSHINNTQEIIRVRIQPLITLKDPLPIELLGSNRQCLSSSIIEL